MRKIRIARLLVILMIVNILVISDSISANAIWQFDVNIYLDDIKMEFDDELGRPILSDEERTLLPFRKMFEASGAEVLWEADTRTAVAVKGDITLRVPIGANYIFRNGKKIEMDTRSMLYNSRTYIPLRAVMEAMDYSVEWYSATKTIDIRTIKEPTQIAKLPRRYDLRNISRVSPVKDQGPIGACWAFASLGAIESVLSSKKLVDLSEDHLSLNHGYNLNQNEGGDIAISLAYFARWSGPVLESDDVYGDNQTSSNAKAKYHIQESRKLPAKDFGAIKRAIMLYGGVQSSIHISDIYGRDFGKAYNKEKASYYYDGIDKANHDILIVGWDDFYNKNNFNKKPDRNGAFICKNSYGKQFGEDGYFYISYRDVHIGTNNLVFTRIDKNTNYDNIYQSDWFGNVGNLGYNSSKAFFANVFTAKKKEKLSAVSFYALGRDTHYSLYLVENFKDEASFENKVFLKKGSFDYEGYYTVNLNEELDVKGDFAVVVEIDTPDCKYPVAGEFSPSENWLKEVDISDGRGYMSANGKHWSDTEEELKSNICLKVFTNNIR